MAPVSLRRGTVHDFKASLALGKAAEVQFGEIFGLTHAGHEERRFDFHLSGGRTLELKTELRPWTETTNMFLEQGTMGKAGGPWRALEDGVTDYAWWFPNPSPVVLWWTDVRLLVDWCEAWLAEKPRYVMLIRNKGFTGRGYLVSRKELEATAARVYRL